MRTVLEVLLWSAVALLAWTYAIYPFLMARLGRAPSAAASPMGDAELPTVAVIVAAFNEERHIGERIENLLAQDYPRGKLRVLVGSDGSRDRTVEIARAHAGERVEVHDFTVNRGKASVLNDLVALSRAEVLVFTDANTVFMGDTVRRLASALDADTAAVCGELVLEKPVEGGDNRDHQYWDSERRLKAAESAIGGLVGANGGVYAMRREHYRPIAPDTICDDFVIAMNVAASGGGLRYVPEAVAYEDTPGDVVQEFHRRARIGIGNYQALFQHPDFLLKSRWALRFTYVSHKVLRWLSPHLLLLVLACSLLLAAEPFYLAFAALQLAGYAVALFAFLSRDRIRWPGIVHAGVFFAVLNVAFLVAFRRFVTADYRGSWRRTERR
jgi:cellulose synthase/poly-beta-1,6-N-acetylglucosamine synthase-like glycosyltransferase